MSRWPRRHLRAWLSPSRVVLATAPALWSRAPSEPAIEASVDGPGGTGAFEPMLEAFREQLPRSSARRRIDVCLSDHFVRYLVLAPRPGMNEGDWPAYALHEFERVYGRSAGPRMLRIAPARRGAARVAAALDVALKKAEEERLALAGEIETLRQKLVAAAERETLVGRAQAQASLEARRSQALATELAAARQAAEEAARRSEALAADRDVARKQIGVLEVKLADTEAALSERVEQARKLTARAAGQEKRIAACETSNAKLKDAGLACIARLETHVLPGLDAILQFERVRLENAIEGYRNDIEDAAAPEATG